MPAKPAPLLWIWWQSGGAWRQYRACSAGRYGSVLREGNCGLLVMLVGRTVSGGSACSCDLSALDLGQDTDELATNGIVGMER